MSLKLKLLGLGVLAALVVSGVSVMNASALTGGHFEADVDHTTLHGADHNGEVHLIDPHKSAETTLSCAEATYTGTITTKTVTQVTITPHYKTGKCFNESGFEVHVHMNGCNYLFTIGDYAHEDNTTHLVCPDPKLGPTLTVTGPFGTCDITVTPNQTPEGGVAYTTAGASGSTHDITADVTVRGIHLIYHGGFFLCGVANGTTSNKGELVGEVTLKGFDTDNNQVGITATGKLGTSKP